MQSLRLFYDVAERRSFSEAAKLHGITQSAASQRISQLEKKLGVTLLDRSVRPLAMTRAGEMFLDGCQNLLERYHQLQRKVVGLCDDAAGRVRVAAIYSAGIDLLEHIREGFEAEHQQIKIQICYKRPHEVYDSVRAHTCELGIVSYPQRWRQVGIIPLRDEMMAVVTCAKHPLTSRTRVGPEDLHGHKLVTFDNTLPVGRQIRRYLRDHGVELTVDHIFDNIDTIKNAVALTDRIAILPKRTVAHEVKLGTLAAIELEPQLVRPLGIIFRPMQRGGEPFAPSAKMFVDYLVTHGRLPIEQPRREVSA